MQIEVALTEVHRLVTTFCLAAYSSDEPLRRNTLSRSRVSKGFPYQPLAMYAKIACHIWDKNGTEESSG